MNNSSYRTITLERCEKMNNKWLTGFLVLGFLLLAIVLTWLVDGGSMFGRGMMGTGRYDNYGYGRGMMGPGMMGGMGMMAVYAPDAKPVSEDVALKSLETYGNRYSTNVEVKDFMAFSINYYSQMIDASTGEGLAEVLVDRYTGAVYPEPGPNMMWNVRFDKTETPGQVSYDQTAAQNLAAAFLAGHIPGSQVMEGQAFPGYYTFDFGRQEIEGMLSVNAFTGDIWVHTWHGSFLGEHE
jgi:hypothetical protein